MRRLRLTLGLIAALLAPSAALAQAQGGAPKAFQYYYSGTGPVTSPPSWTPVSATNPLPVNATVSASITGFPTTQTTGTPISVTTGGVSGTLPTGTVVVASNVGATNGAYCKLGASATTSDQLIPPNAWFAFTVGSATQLTCITSTSTTTVNMVGGSGLPTGSGGGAGGGGGGAVTIADGADVTQGAKADSVCGTATGTCSVSALLKYIANAVSSQIAAGTAYIGQVGLNAVASGGWTPKWFVAANSDNATNLKGSAGIVHAVEVFGIGSAPAYLKFYDKATTPTCASDTIVKQIMIPAASTAGNGAGSVNTPLDAQFSSGISYCVVTGIGATDDTSVAAATFVVNIDWK